MSETTSTATVYAFLDAATFAPSHPPHTYLGVAASLLSGVKVLADAEPSHSAYALALVASHTLECLLKASLSPNGDVSRLSKSSIRHDLMALWDQAQRAGLAVSLPAPDWVQNLGRIHDNPYYLRYSKGINAIALPAAQPMAADQEEIMRLVRDHLRSALHLVSC